MLDPLLRPYCVIHYIGEGDWRDRAIRWATDSEISHSELALVDHETTWCRAISASARDGGVRIKDIDLGSGNWMVQRVGAWADVEACRWARAWLGYGYDWKGILMSQTLAFHRHSESRKFCSELVGLALGLHRPNTLSPGTLRYRIDEMNEAHLAGYTARRLHVGDAAGQEAQL